MAITEDASQPAVIHATGTSGTTTAFTPPANSLIAVFVVADGLATNTETATVTDSGGHTWTLKKRQNTSGNNANPIGGTTECWEIYFASSPGSITVTASWSPTTSANGGNIVTRVLDGAASDQSTAATAGTASNGSTTINPTITITPTQVGSRIYGTILDFTSSAALTMNASTTDVDQFNDTTNGDTWDVWRNAADTTTLTSKTFGSTNSAGAYQLIAVEILPASTTAPAYPFSLVHRGRTAVPARARGHASTPAPAQASPPFQPAHRTRQVMGRLRGRVSLFAPPQVVVPPPPYVPPTVHRLRQVLGRIRGRSVAPVPAQVVVTPPAYPPPPVHRLRAVLGRVRGRAATPVPAQVAVAPPPYVPAERTPRRFVALLRRTHAATPPLLNTDLPSALSNRSRRVPFVSRRRTATPPAGATLPPQPLARPRRVLFVARRRQATPVPPQVVIVPPPYPPMPVYKRLLAFVTRRGRVESAPQTSVVVVPPPRTPTLTVDLARATVTAETGRLLAVSDTSRTAVVADLSRVTVVEDLTRPVVVVAL